jgi:sugar phosphate permease
VTTEAQPVLPPGGAKPTHIRYQVLGFTFLAYMITYINRVCISNAVPSIQKEFGFSIVTVGWILSSFQWGYALFQIPGGWLGDRIGARRALALIITLRSFFTSAVTLAWNDVSMFVIQFLCGTAEAGVFPIATSSLSRWMLPSERGIAQGSNHAGSRLGGAITPILVVFIIAHWGWRAAFVCCSCLGVIWAAAWYWFYRNSPAEHRAVNEGERNLIESALENEFGRRAKSSSVPWRQILHSPQMWILSAMYFCYSYDLSVYLFWFPKYLNARRGFDLAHMGYFSSLVLLAGVVGDLAGGGISDLWAKRWGDLKKARRTMGAGGFLLCAICLVPASLASNPYVSVAFSCGAILGLEMTVGVSWAVALDIGEHFAGSVSAMMNMCGNIGGAVALALSGYLVKFTGWNTPFLLMAGLAVIGAALYLRINAGRSIVAA